jgi:hypothetical protein
MSDCIQCGILNDEPGKCLRDGCKVCCFCGREIEDKVGAPELSQEEAEHATEESNSSAKATLVRVELTWADGRSEYLAGDEANRWREQMTFTAKKPFYWKPR